MLQAVAPNQTPLGPIMRLADIHLVAVTVEKRRSRRGVNLHLCRTPATLALGLGAGVLGGGDVTWQQRVPLGTRCDGRAPAAAWRNAAFLCAITLS
jgi:hypothetical protein